MSDQNFDNSNDHNDVSVQERLLSVLADGEAGDADRARFDQLADYDPTLWRQLAGELETSALLERALEDELEAAFDVDLPDQAMPDIVTVQTSRGPWIAAGIGWAAVLVFAALWWFNAGGAETNDNLQPVDLPPIESIMTHEQAYDYYLDAPWVRGEMQPHLIEIKDLPNGMKRYWILRRIEEYIDVPAHQVIDVDASRNLMIDPRTLRGGAATDPDSDKQPGS